MNKFLSKLLVVAALFAYQTIDAQNATFTDIYDLMQVKCASCHGGASPAGNMDLSGTPDEVYDVLVGTTPTNPAATHLTVNPGYPERSFLLHKIATQQWDEKYGLVPAEGNVMPPNGLPALPEKEIELVRQWILAGAPKDEMVVDPQLLEDYYENGLALPETEPMAPPAAGEGFQLEFGPFFLAPLEEREVFKKHKLLEDDNYEINGLDIAFNTESHHFILYKMNQAIANSRPEGLRNVEDSEASMFQNTLVASWQNAIPYDLPEGAAYRVENGTTYDLNYHIKNYNVTGVLAAKVYINVYTQPTGIAEEEMYSLLFPISLFDMFQGQPLGSGLVIPNDGENHVFTEHLWIPPVANVPFPTGTWHIWQLSTHTHARGVDYDIYLSEGSILNPSKGEQIFEGFYNFNYTFNQGFYDWEHPPVRIFDQLLPVDMSSGGLIHEATYVNNTDETKVWGNSVDDEMMLIFVHFTTGPLETTATYDVSDKFDISVFPNPTSDISYINYTLDQSSEVEFSIFDMQGKNKWQRNIGKQAVGNNVYELNTKDLDLPPGIYFVKTSIDGQVVTRKLVVE